MYETDSLKIAHLSDIHFCSLLCSPFSCFNKRIKGWCRLLMGGTNFTTERVNELIPLLTQHKVQHVFITGDLTLTASTQEFKRAFKFIQNFSSHGIGTDVLPGNHDCYTKASNKKRPFYHYFPNEELRKNRMYLKQLTKHWFWIGLDGTFYPGWFAANGRFLPEMEAPLRNLLASLPISAKVIIGHHFPILETAASSHDLLNRDILKQILKDFPCIKLYLHGHNHNSGIVDLRHESLPLMVDAGSLSFKPKPTFFTIDLSKDKIVLEHFNITNLSTKNLPLSLNTIERQEVSVT